jgi:anthranilate synthase/aminodeoxychorismate synthase-like glutamine amidotransferase
MTPPASNIGPNDGEHAHWYRPSRVIGVSPRVLVIDNFDSFVYILVQYIGELGAEPIVIRNNAAGIDELDALAPDAVLISPGPGRPEDAGVSNDAIRHFAPTTPVLGVCLGHQCIGQVYGGTVSRARELMHGKTSQIEHGGEGVFKGLPSPLEATRYHSLIVERESVPDAMEVTARTRDGLVMGLRHREHDVQGVQFHPESVLTMGGKKMIANWLDLDVDVPLAVAVRG